MQWMRCYVAAAFLAVSTSVGLAAEPACFDLFPSSNTSGPEGAVLLNRCTGESWLLTSVNTGSGSSLGWRQIPVDMSSEEQQTTTQSDDNSTTDADAAHAD